MIAVERLAPLSANEIAAWHQRWKHKNMSRESGSERIAIKHQCRAGVQSQWAFTTARAIHVVKSK